MIKLFYYKDEFVFGTVNIEHDISPDYTVKIVDEVPSNLIIVEASNQGQPHKIVTNNYIPKYAFLLSHIWFAKDLLSFYKLKNHIFYLHDDRIHYTVKHSRGIDKSKWKRVTTEYLIDKVWNEPGFLLYSYIRHFPSEKCVEAFFNKHNKQDEMDAITAGYDYVIYTDGAFAKTKGLYSWAFTVYQNGYEVYCDYGVCGDTFFKPVGMLAAEYMALYQATIYALRNNLDNVILVYDSQNMETMLTEDNFNEWKNWVVTNNLPRANFEVQLELNNRFCSLMIALNKEITAKCLNYSFTHVKGHSNIEGNMRTDFLAKQIINRFHNVLNAAYLTNCRLVDKTNLHKPKR